MRTICLALLTVVLVSNLAESSLTSVEVTPQAPIDGDSITITMKGFYDQCWHFIDARCGLLTENEFLTEIFLKRDDSCTGVAAEYSLSCQFDDVSEGTYYVFAIEYPTSEIIQLEIVVSGISTPIFPITWGQIKARYGN